MHRLYGALVALDLLVSNLSCEKLLLLLLLLLPHCSDQCDLFLWVYEKIIIWVYEKIIHPY
jgi:hypothetical protein